MSEHFYEWFFMDIDLAYKYAVLLSFGEGMNKLWMKHHPGTTHIENLPPNKAFLPHALSYLKPSFPVILFLYWIYLDLLQAELQMQDVRNVIVHNLSVSILLHVFNDWNICLHLCILLLIECSTFLF